MKNNTKYYFFKEIYLVGAEIRFYHVLGMYENCDTRQIGRRSNPASLFDNPQNPERMNL